MDPDQSATVSQQVAWGKQARKTAPRSSHQNRRDHEAVVQALGRHATVGG